MGVRFRGGSGLMPWRGFPCGAVFPARFWLSGGRGGGKIGDGPKRRVG